jgi:hypothetical protein
VKVLLVPDLDEPEVLIDLPVPADVSVIEPVQTPAMKAVVLVGLMIPARAISSLYSIL